jgi:vacuolar protein sorting-associated protein VTA1
MSDLDFDKLAKLNAFILHFLNHSLTQSTTPSTYINTDIMPLALPAELKKITPYIRRAEELDKDKSNAESRLVAYYCRQYAVHNGIALAQSPGGKTALGGILNDLETEKVAMSAFNREESHYLCRQFAEKVFNKADAEDRAGAAGKSTAKTFYAAASFLEILQQFYSDDEEGEERAEIQKKVVYAKWKATDILKAMKEGREPTPGGYGEQEENAMEDDEEETAPPEAAPPAAASDMMDLPVPPSAFAPPPVPIAPPEIEEVTSQEGTEFELGPPPAYPGALAAGNDDDDDNSEVFEVMPPPVPVPKKKAEAPQKPRKAGGIFGGAFGGGSKSKSKIDKEKIDDAMELTQFALAALQSKDGELAATRLQQALDALCQ